MTWHTQPLAGFDLETTSVDVETARIVTAALVTYSPNGEHATRTWVADPGIAIPDEAAKIHGYDTARARAEGRPAAEVAEEVAAAVAAALGAGTPVVAMNARFDFSVLDRELRRHGLATLEQRLGREAGPVVDPFVLDKQADKYRKGSRKLEALAVHYGVTLAAAHTADADALAAVEVAVAIAEKYPQLQVHPEQLHVWQIWWAAEQAAGLQQHLRKTDPYAVIDGEWPLIPLTGERKLRAALTTLADRYEEMAKCAPNLGDELLIDEPTPTQLQQIVRASAYRKAAASIRNVLRTGHVPHYLMTDAELEKYGTPERAS
jgi:DNA polymerase-3 subunit epsilon